jgi:hypothetical protein
MERDMENKVAQLKLAVREILGDVPSAMFISRVEKTLDDGAGDMESLISACSKMERSVRLFINADLASVLDKRCMEILAS